jgi:EAL and modified HD-GYP domain-containing signal transduction protein
MAPGKNDVCIARQPILNSKNQIQAYELLFRDNSQSDSADFQDHLLATNRVLINTLNNIGTQKILGDKLGFINVDSSFLLKQNFETLDPKVFVLEILETTTITPPVKASIEKAKSDGFTIALDDFIFSDEHIEAFREIIPLADIIKIDLIVNEVSTLQEKISGLKNFTGIYLAEKVETKADYQACHSIGIQLFQGYYFAKPIIVEGKKLDPNELAVISLVKVLQSQPETEIIDDEFKRYPDLTINLLRFMNSAALTRGNQINSIRQVITLIGQKKLLQWLLLMLYGSTGVGNPSNPLYTIASQRAKTIEVLLSKHLKTHDQGDLGKGFLVGIVSQMDALLSLPMQDILAEFNLDHEINNAIQNREGKLGKLLQLCICSEQYKIPEIRRLCEELGLELSQVTDANMTAYQWVEAFMD